MEEPRKPLLGTLRRQLILGMVGINAVWMLVFMLYLTSQQRRTLKAVQRTQVQDLARNLAEAAAPWVSTRDLAGLQEIVAGLKQNPQVTYAMLLDDHGRVLAHTQPGRRNQFVQDLPGPGNPQQPQDHGQTLDASAPCFMGSTLIGWARVGYDQGLVHAEMVKVTHFGVIYGLLSILLIALLSTALGRSLTRRLYIIRQVSSALVRGERGLVIPPLGKDEVGDLGRDLTTMLSALKAGEAEIMALNEQLEKKVADRTAALVANAALLRTLFDTLPDLVWLKDPAGVYLACNRRFERFFGAREAAILGKTDYAFVGRDQADLFRRGDQMAMASGGATILEAPMTITFADDGHEEVLEVGKTPVFGPGGELLGILGLGRNITERKRTEDALKQNEERLRLALQATKDGIWDWNLVTGEVYRSPGWLAMFGYSEDLAREGLDAVRSLIHPDDQARVTQASHQAITQGIGYSVETRMRCADGTWMWINSRGSVSARDADGKAIRLSGTNSDIHQRKLAEQENQILVTKLHQAQKMESLGLLASGVAHDMNNVLAAILSMASANLAMLTKDSPTTATFETIRAAATRGGNMVKRLLTFARQGPSETRELDVNALLQEQARLLEATILTKVHLVLDLAPELHPIQGDGGALSHAVMNLCINAMDAMDPGGTITLRTRTVSEDEIELTVEDQGTGMTKEVMDRAIDPFFTTKEVGKGTGLGLSMVYATMNAHGGALELQSEPGQGTRVKLRFPAARAQAPDAEAVAPTPPRAATPALTVLLVDDDELIQYSTGMLLKVLGHAVTLASRGEEALALLEAGLQPDLIILDMNMPGLGGQGTLPRLRALSPATPVLLATGRADQDALDLVAAHARVALLSKPFSIEQLQEGLQTFLHHGGPRPLG